MWFLDAYIEGSSSAKRYAVDSQGQPLRIGRSRKAGVTLPFEYVSGLHAEVNVREGKLWLTDLGSANGTFVNASRCECEGVMLEVGDIVHIGGNEFVVAEDESEDEATSATFAMQSNKPPKFSSIALQTAGLHALLSARKVRAVFEPIVELAARPRAIGFEILGRGTHSDAPEFPGPLLQIADSVDKAAALSTLFRTVGLDDAMRLPGRPRIFVNTHPAEMGRPELLKELTRLRRGGVDCPLTIEIHEASVLDHKEMVEFSAAISDLDIGLAYDDFGVGQARLNELLEIPPDFLKFDMSLVRGIDVAPLSRIQLLRSLVSMVRDLGIACLAEGIETPGEYETCCELGFTHGQGYLLSRGQPVEHWIGRMSPAKEALPKGPASA